MLCYITFQQAQQAGRCGRGRLQPEALSIIVCFDSPVDQYYASHPEELFRRDTEQATLQTNNPYILRSHLLCAALEVPLNYDFSFAEDELWGDGYAEAIQYLMFRPTCSEIPSGMRADKTFIVLLVLLKKMCCFLCTCIDANVINLNTIQSKTYEHAKLVKHVVEVALPTAKYCRSVYKLHPYITNPARDVNLRACDPATFQVIVEAFVSHNMNGSGTNILTNGSVLGNVGYSRAFYELHEGAIYLHQGKQYLITHLSLDSLFAKCIPVRVPYHTAAHDHFQIDILRQLHGNGLCGFGMATVKCSVSGYVKIFRDGGNGSRVVWGGDCSLPQLVSFKYFDRGICCPIYV